MNTIVIDLDNTITHKKEKNIDYLSINPRKDVVDKIIEYKENGFDIIIHTARNMNSFSKDISKINAFTLPNIVKWLEMHNIPYDGIMVGKPWCGKNGFYVDDRAIRRSEFLKLTLLEIEEILKAEENI